MTVSTATLKSLKKLLLADDVSLVEQGAELALSLDDDDLIATLLADGRWKVSETHADHWGQLLVPPALMPRGQSHANAQVAFMTLLARSRAPAAQRICDTVASLELDADGLTADLSLLAGFTRLERLRVSNANHVAHLDAIAALPALRALDFQWCYNLHALDGLASNSLQTLRVISLARVGSPGALPALRELDLGNASQLQDLDGLASLRALESIVASEAPQVNDLSPLKKLSKLRTLSLQRAAALSSLDGIEGCTALESLTLTSTRITSIEPLRGLSALRSLDLTGAPIDSVDALRAHPLLTHVTLTATRVESISELSDAKALCELRVSGTPLRAIDLHRSPDFARFEIDDCRALESVVFLRGYSALRTIHWANLPALRTLDGIEASAPELTRVHIMGCQSLFDLTALGTAAKLRDLTLADARMLSSLAGLEGCARLQKLSLTNAVSLQRLASLGPSRELLSVSLFGATALSDISCLAGASALQTLDLRGAAELTDISCLAKLKELSSVWLYGSGVTRGSVPRQLRDRCDWKVVPDRGAAMRAPLRAP